MTTNTVIPFEERIEKASKILGKSKKQLTEILSLSGVDGNELLDASTTSHNDIHGILSTKDIIHKVPLLKLKAVVGILKGEDPFKKKIGINKVDKPITDSDKSAIIALLESQKPITNWSDEDVLNGYIESDREDLESELQRRSKNRPFIILKDRETQEIDVSASLVMLKRARKEEIPSSITTKDNKFIKIYKVEQYHKGNRIFYESPLRPGIILFDGYCNSSKLNFDNVSEPAKKMLRLIHNDLGQESRSEETHWVMTAEKDGIDGLARMFPEIHENYMNLASTENLPSLKVLKPMETKADPFYSSNHKVF